MGLRAGRFSPIDLAEAAIEDAARWQPVINAFVTIDEAGARAAAAVAARELATGVDRGPLHGIPFAVKDMIDVRGLPTTAGSRHPVDRIAPRDAECVRLLRDAGAVMIGKTTTHEFANGPTGDRAASGPTCNPYAPARMAGGSSSGSAAAVSAGVVPIALGTDTGGSTRIPAAYCGIVGLRPTHGVLSTAGVLPLAPTLDTVGFVTRTADDARTVWEALAPEVRPATAQSPRLGWVPPDTIHPTVSAVADAAHRFAEPLLTGEEVRYRAGALTDVYRTLQGYEAFTQHVQRLRRAPELYEPEVRDRLLAGGAVTREEYAAAALMRTRARAAVLSVFRRVDILALPTVPILPPVLDERVLDIAGKKVEIVRALLSLTSPWSVLGLPAVSVPVTLLDGLPTALQLIGRPGTESRLLDAAGQLSRRATH